MDAPFSSPLHDIDKHENKMFLLVANLYYSNEEKSDKVRKLFDEFVFSEKPNYDEISLQSQDHKKALIEMRNAFLSQQRKLLFKNMFVDKLRLYDERQKFYEETKVTVNPPSALSLEEIGRKLSSLKMDKDFNSDKDEKKPTEEIERIERIDLGKEFVLKNKERIDRAHEMDDEALARQLSLELNGEHEDTSDEAYARKLQKEMDFDDRFLVNPAHSRYEPGFGYFQQPIPRRSGFVEFNERGNLGHYYPAERKREPIDPEDGIPEPFFKEDLRLPKDVIINQNSSRFTWLGVKDKAFIEAGTRDKVVKCYLNNKISINENCAGITLSQIHKGEINIIASEVTIKGAVECHLKIMRGSKVILVDCPTNNQIVLSVDSQLEQH